jgi:IS30 family transposase
MTEIEICLICLICRTLSEVQGVIVELNDRPRKKLNYKTPAKLMAEHMGAMAA